MASGALGEAAVLKELIKQGYTVFTQFDGQSPFDMVAYKDNKLYRVSVKSTNTAKVSGAYKIELAQQASKIYSGKYFRPFDNTTFDILAVYIVKEDVVILYNASDIYQTRTLRVKIPNVGNTTDTL